MDRVIAGFYRNSTSADRHVSRCVDPVVAACDIQRAALDVEVPLFARDRKALIAAIYPEVRFHDPAAVIDVDRIPRSRHGYRAARDHEVVVGLYAVPVVGCDRQRTAAVDRQVVVGVDRAVRAVLKRLIGILSSARDRVVASLSERQKDLIRLIHSQPGVVRAGDLHPVKEQPDL